VGRSGAVLQALVAVTIWGASFAATKQLLGELSPASVLFARTVLGTLLLAGGLAVRRELRPLPAHEWPQLVRLALLGLVLTPALQAWALQRSTSANTAWLVALNPVVTALLAAGLLGERLTGKTAGLVIAFGGAVLVVSGGLSLPAALALPSTRGDLLTLVSNFSWALYTVFGRRYAGRHAAPLVTAHLLAIAGLVFLPFFVAGAGWHELAALSRDGWLCLAYLGLGCSGIGLLLYYAALAHLGAAQVAAFIYLEPLIAQGLAVALMAEPLTAAVLAGGAAILIGVYLVSRSRAEAVP
jgi:drug/metabolite transporter (DMT)-like permease